LKQQPITIVKIMISQDQGDFKNSVKIGASKA